METKTPMQALQYALNEERNQETERAKSELYSNGTQMPYNSNKYP